MPEHVISMCNTSALLNAEQSTQLTVCYFPIKRFCLVVGRSWLSDIRQTRMQTWRSTADTRSYVNLMSNNATMNLSCIFRSNKPSCLMYSLWLYPTDLILPLFQLQLFQAKVSQTRHATPGDCCPCFLHSSPAELLGCLTK